MKHDRDETADVEPHVFDQTNGVVDLGTDEPARSSSTATRDRTVGGIAMLSTQKP